MVAFTPTTNVERIDEIIGEDYQQVLGLVRRERGDKVADNWAADVKKLYCLAEALDLPSKNEPIRLRLESEFREQREKVSGLLWSVLDSLGFGKDYKEPDPPQ